MEERERLILFPVRRRLAVLCSAYLLGIYGAQIVAVPAAAFGILCAFLLTTAFLRAKRRKSALLFVAAVFLLVGNGMACRRLALRDEPSQPDVLLVGEIDEIEKENRVWLRGVLCDGERLHRRALVTLMTNEGEEGKEVFVGQIISGTGRLFAPSESRNPGGVNGRVRALAQNYELSGYVLPNWTASGAKRFSMRETLRQIRNRLMRHMENVFGEHAPLFQAILLGNRENMDKELVNAMRLTGIVHLLTVSGMHLTLIALMMEKVLSRVPCGRWMRFVLQTVGLLFYTGLTGAAAGTVRAFIMAVLRGLAKCRGRRYEPLTALAFAALTMALINPIWPLDASFQFSFFVLLGILLTSGTISAWCARRMAWVRRHPRAAEALTLSLSAQITAMPIQLLFYGYVPLLALPVNAAAGGLMSVIMMGGIVCSVAGAFVPTVGRFIGGTLGWATGSAEALIVKLAKLEGNICRLPAPYVWSIPIAIVVMMLFSSRIRFGKARRKAFAAALCALALSYLPRFAPDARYVQLDVGQGDAAILRHGRHATLVDVGAANSYDALRYLRHEGLYVDSLILSHLDEDHAGALDVLMQSEIDISRVVMPSGAQVEDASTAVQNGFRTAEEKGVLPETVSAGDRIVSGDYVFDVLSPREGLTGENERSLVLYTQSMGSKILMMGDLPAKSEMDDPPDCDVLKVAHHGSKYATSDAFVEKTTPSLAMISVGANNRYGHPTERVIKALESVGAAIYRTDESGCITLWLSDKSATVQTYLNGSSSNASPAAYTP
ncbi:MAG: DNA internalization-related competence protein ComEC/Rec2 [Christensenellales bacterium]